MTENSGAKVANKWNGDSILFGLRDKHVFVGDSVNCFETPGDKFIKFSSNLGRKIYLILLRMVKKLYELHDKKSICTI